MVGEGGGSFSGISWENNINASNTVTLPGGWSHVVGGYRTGLEHAPISGAVAQLWEELTPWEPERKFLSLHSIGA